MLFSASTGDISGFVSGNGLDISKKNSLSIFNKPVANATSAVSEREGSRTKKSESQEHDTVNRSEEAIGPSSVSLSCCSGIFIGFRSKGFLNPGSLRDSDSSSFFQRAQ